VDLQMKVIQAIRESILNAKDTKTLKRYSEIASLMSDQLDEVPDRTKRRWKLAEKRAEKRLQLNTERSAATSKKERKKK